MPRSTLRGNGAPLMALSDGLNERALRAAANRESQQEQVEPPVQAADHVNVGGIVINAFANAAQAAAAGEEGAAEDDGVGSAAGDTEEQGSPLEAGAGDVFDFPAGADDDGEEDDEDNGAHIDEAAVDGENARDEDAREHNLAEAAAEEEAEAVVLPARVVPAARNPAPRVHFVAAVGGRGKVAPGVPARHRRRKVLR